MIKTEIIIPTIKSNEALWSFTNELSRFCTVESKAFLTGPNNRSAAENRNDCFNQCEAEYCIMADDDITGLYKGWIEDMIRPLKNYKLVSARLMKPNGQFNTMIDYGHKLSFSGIREVALVPAACIAFKRETLQAIKDSPDFPDNTPFDENYKKACYEDSDICRCITKMYGQGKIAVNNDVKIIHMNEEKWRPGFRWEDNKEYYMKKWENQ